MQQGYSKSSVDNLPSHVREFLHFSESNYKCILDEIGPADIQSYYQYLCKRPNKTRSGGLSSVMLTHHIYALRVFFSWLVRLEAIEFDPLTGLDFPRPKYRKRIACSVEEVRRMFDMAGSLTDKALLALFYGCGLRRSEAYRLDRQDIDLNNNRLIVRKGKLGKRRELPLNGSVKAHLQQYIHHGRGQYLRYDHPDGQKALIVSTIGKRMSGSTMAKHISALGIKAHVDGPVFPHRLRHSIATHLKDRGMPMKLIQQFLEHNSLDVTELYLTGNRQTWRKRHKHQRRIHKGKLYGDI